MKSCHKEHDCSSRMSIVTNKAVNQTALFGFYDEIMTAIMGLTSGPC
jgi:hypothetical protein